MPAEQGRRPPLRKPGPPGTNVRSDLLKTARLWGLAVICASVGAYVVSRTNALLPGVSAFLIALAICGPLLYLYERRRR